MKKTAIIFPGQGSQYVGMGQDFYNQIRESRMVYEESNEVLNKNIRDIIFNGTEIELQETVNTQPAILATSIAILRALEKEGISCSYTAGLSLGEYSSLVLGRTIEYKDALRLVQKRGSFMQEAIPIGQGGMLAVLGMGEQNLKKLLEYSKGWGCLDVANYNSPGQVVLTGDTNAIRQAQKVAVSMGARRTVELPVSAPFHSKLLQGAGERLRETLKGVKLRDSNTDIVTNVDAKSERKREKIREKLVKQVSSSVMWQQSVEYMLNEGVDEFIEVGPGKTLTGFVKRIAKEQGKKVDAHSINDIDSYKEVIRKKRG